MPLPTYYAVGTASVANGDTTITFSGALLGTADAPNIQAGDLFFDPAQPLVPGQRIASVDYDNDSAELWAGWPGTSMTSHPYEARYTGDPIRSTAQTRRYLEMLGQLASIGVQPDAFGEYADRDAYDDAAVGFIFLSLNGDDGATTTAWTLYTKLSSDDADWSAGQTMEGAPGTPGDSVVWITGAGAPAGGTGEDADMYLRTSNGDVYGPKAGGSWGSPVANIKGATGATGITWRGTYSGATAYAERDMVENNGSTWIALQATTGNAPPTLPTTSTAYWELAARRGTDGAGTVSGVGAGSGIDIDATDPTNPVVSVETNLQEWNTVDPSSNGKSLVSAADYAAMRALLDLEVGTDFYSISSVDSAVASAAAGVAQRTTARVATTANITISTALNSGDTIDGVTLANGDLVLVKNQSAPEQNGIYVVSGSPARSAQFDTYNEHPGALIIVQEGTTNADTFWYCTSNVGGTLNTTAIAFTALTLSVAAATTSAAGIVELTTDAEAKTRTDTSRAITASNLPGVLLDAPAVRQTVLSGPVTTAGLSSFGGSTGSGTVTASGTLVATAANGAANRSGSITNPSWTGLTSNGTMYLYLDIAADGTCTPGSTTVAPIYQWGGTPATTSGLFTFNIQEMAGYVGNGSSAPQTYRVFVGEVTVAGSVVTAITWYSLMGRYRSALTSLRSSAGADSFSHNIGTVPRHKRIVLVNTTAELGYSVGDEIDAPVHYAGSGTYLTTNPICGALTAVVAVPTTMAGGGLGFYIPNKSTGATVGGPTTAASWRYKVELDRGW